MKNLTFDLFTDGITRKKEVTISNLCIIGYAGRNIEKTMEHVREMATIGVKPPKSIPEINHCGTSIITQDDYIEAVGADSCGEVEFIFFESNGKIYIGIGSDITDRAMESYHMQKSKQVCQKPIGKELWAYSEVKDHWDQLTLTSWQTIQGENVLYQKGTAADILPIEDLYAAVKKEVPETENCLAFSGTVPLIDGFKFGTSFYGRIDDPVLKRSLELNYDIIVVSK